MALTASLSVDIKDFQKGLDAAALDLQTFAKAANRVNKDINKLGEEFSGQKIAAEAARVVKVVEDLGGASKLTATEAAKVNATVTEAIAKYKALGETAPQALLDMQAATQGVVDASKTTTIGLKDLAVGFAAVSAAAVAVGAALWKGTQASIEYASSLSDLSAATGVSTTDLQVLEQVTAGTPANLEAIAKATNKMSLSLLGDKGAAAAVEALGLSVESLVAAGPADAFLDIGAALAAIENPMERAKIGTEIFGKTFADIAPAVTTDMAVMGDQIRATGALLSEELVANGDAAGDALERLNKTAFNLMAEALLPMVPALTAVADYLSKTLPPAVDSARAALFSLIEQWLELRITVQQTAADLLQAAHDVPLLGKAFGASSKSVEYFQGLADESRKYLVALRLTGIEPVTAAVAKGAPALTTYGTGLGKVKEGADKAAKGLSFVDGELNPLTLAMIQGTVAIDQWGTATAGAAEEMAYLADSIALARGEAIQIQPVLENAFKGTAIVPLKAAVEEANTAIPGFFGKLGEGLTTAGINVNTLSQTFMSAFMGGGGALGAVQSFATQGLSALMGMIPLVGPFISQFAGPLIAMFSKLGSKLKDWFGGVSAEEREARKAVEAFEESLWGTLTAVQAVEAGNEDWKKTVVAVRDAYIAAGKTEAEALEAVEKLWASSKDGAEATKAAVEAIRTVLAQAGHETTTFAADVAKAVDAIPDEVVIDVRGNYSGPDVNGSVESFQHGSGGIQDFGGGTAAVLHGRERVQTEAQMRAEAALGHALTPRASGSVVTIDARGAFLGDLQSQMRFRRIVSDALMSEAELRTGLAPAGAF